MDNIFCALLKSVANLYLLLYNQEVQVSRNKSGMKQVTQRRCHLRQKTVTKILYLFLYEFLRIDIVHKF